MKVIGIITTVLITLILTPIWRGYALSKLWLWFIVSAFNVNALGISQSIGLALVVSFLTSQYNPYIDKDKSTNLRMTESVIYAFLTPAFALFIGWIVKAFI